MGIQEKSGYTINVSDVADTYVFKNVVLKKSCKLRD